MRCEIFNLTSTYLSPPITYNIMINNVTICSLFFKLKNTHKDHIVDLDKSTQFKDRNDDVIEFNTIGISACPYTEIVLLFKANETAVTQFNHNFVSNNLVVFELN